MIPKKPAPDLIRGGYRSSEKDHDPTKNLTRKESTMKRLAAVLALILGVGSALSAKEARCADVIRLGEGPFLSGGGFFVAQALDYFKKLGLDVQVREFQDGALAVPSFISGE